MMSRSKNLILGLAALGCLGTQAAAETDAEYLRRKLSVGYLHEPATATPQWDVVSPEDFDRGTTASPFFSSRESAPFRNLCNALFRAGTTDGVVHSRLQKAAAQIVNIRDNAILTLFVNDATQRVPANPGYSCWRTGAGLLGGQGIRTAGGRSSTFGGTVTFGSNYWARQSMSRVMGQFVHYLVHTQDRSTPNGHFDGPVDLLGNNVWIMNPDNGNLAAESVAQFFQMWVDLGHYERVFNWWRRGDNQLFINSHPDSRTPRGGCDANVLVATLRMAGITSTTGGPLVAYDANYARFLNSSLNAPVLARHEAVLGMVFYQCARLTGLLRIRQAYRSAMLRYSPSPAQLVNSSLHQLGEEILGADLTTSIRADQDAKALLPFALIDYYTRFRCGDKNDFKRMLGMEIVDDLWIDSYFDQGFRRKIQQGAANLPTDRDINMILRGLNVTT